MTAIGRAFVAIELPDTVRAAVRAEIDVLRARPDAEGLRWARDDWHSTLQFLGRVADADAVVGALERALARVAPTTIRLAGGGAFPKPRRGTVLWLGVDEGADDLAALSGAVTDATRALGHRAERRAFRPHVTLARARAPHDLRGLVEAIGTDPLGPPWDVRALVLFASDTRPEGAVHSEVARIRLAG